MKHSKTWAWIGTVAMAGLFGVPGATPCPAQQECGNGQWACQEVIVRMRPGQPVQSINTSYGTSVLRSVASRGIYLLQVPPQMTEEVFQHTLAHDPRVAWAELNGTQRAPEGQTQSFFLNVTQSDYQQQLGAALTHTDLAHRYSIGAGVTVAVLDTGLDPTHPLFAGRIAPGGFNFVSDSGDFCDAGTGSCVGHGTFVAGVVLRVAPAAWILPLKVLDADGVGTSFNVAQAVFAAIDSNVRLMNLSLGSTVPSITINEAVQEASSRGIAVVAAAGNNNQQSPAFYPAATGWCIAVAATDAADHKADFSDYGSYITLSAPGVGIVGPVPGSAYAASDGTSFATPWITGTAALLLSRNPGAACQSVQTWLVRGCADTDPLNPRYVGLLGAGRVDAMASIAAQGKLISIEAATDR